MTHENERSAEVVVVLLDIVRVIVGCLPVVHCVEVETRIFVLNGFEERFERHGSYVRSAASHLVDR